MQRTKSKLKDLTGIVTKILEDKPLARDNDMVLLGFIINECGFSCNITYKKLYNLISQGIVPSLESVGRVRRKVQQLNPDLKPSDEIHTKRKALIKEYVAYNRETTKA